jgi:hypothetical protein
MNGQVEIYKVFQDGTERLVHKEGNLIVDEARKIIAEMMTIPPFIANIPTASAVLNTSNWTVQAISFGKDASSYYGNLHGSTFTVLDGTTRPSTDSNNVPYSWVSAAGYHKGYTNVHGLPTYPSPIDKVLEPGIYPYDSSATFYQLPNFIQFSSQLGLTAAQAIASGCWPVSQGSGTSVHVSSYNNTTIGQYNKCMGAYNLRGTMDYRGYVKLNYAASAQTNIDGNFIVSSNSTFSSLREVAYITQMYDGDMELLQLYGGIYSLGLWAINTKLLLQTSSAPFNFTTYPSSIPFKLFSKKSFLRDLTTAESDLLPTGNPPVALLKIVWRIFF